MPLTDEFPLLTVADWHAAYRAGASPRVLLQARQARLLRDAAPKAWIAQAPLADVQARADALIAAAEGMAFDTVLARWPLYGVPFAIKDNIDAAGWPTTAACPAWSKVAAANATVVQRLLDAGAVLLGKTNLDQFATGLVGTRSPYGAPASALAHGRVSGGSSSGSAVAVARGEVPFALGTDTAGSGRVPAGLNGLVGIKPTPGRASTRGVLPACRSLDCVSIFALTVDDAATVLALMEGADEGDAYSQARRGPAGLPTRLRIGVPKVPVLDAAVGYPAAWQQAIEQARSMGAELVLIDTTPLHEVAALLYDGPWVAERYAVVQTLLDTQPEAFDPTVAAVIGKARNWSAVDTFRATYVLEEARRSAAKLWSDIDVLMVPTAPTHPRFEEVAADPLGANAQLGLYTNFVNLLGWCALALPAATAGTAHEPLPFGVTFIAPGDADAALARFGRTWQATAGKPLGATGRACDSAVVHSSTPWPQSQATLPIAVVGAHLSDMPLNKQLTERGAQLRRATRTAPLYRLFSLPATTPPKPGLLRVGAGGHAIELEVWDMPVQHIGSFLALIPSPLSLGSVQLEDGTSVHGFLCEPIALEGAADISRFGGWRAWIASLSSPSPSPAPPGAPTP